VVYPAALDSFANPSGTDAINGAKLHHVQHSQVNDAVAAVEAKLGTGASTPAFGEALVATDGGTAWQGKATFDMLDYDWLYSGDSYAALAAAVADLNAAGGGILLLRRKEYLQDRYVTASNGITDITIQNCDGVLVLGYGATISVKGNIDRSVSTTRTLRGLTLTNCTNVSVEGLTIDGNADLATNSGSVAEAASHGLAIYGCRVGSFRNLRVHHSTCDNVYISDYNKVASRDLIVESVRCENAARQALSIIQLRTATFKSCQFLSSGITGGSYGSHAPQAGVDIEPNYIVPTVDVNTGHITFDTCEFRNNQGSQFVSGQDNPTVEFVNFHNCDIVAETSPQSWVMILSIYRWSIDDCRVSCTNPTNPNSAIYAVWGTGARQRGVIRNSEVRGKNTCITAVGTVQYGLVIEKNTLICEATSPLGSYFPNISSPDAIFRDNDIFIPAAAHPGGGIGITSSLVQYCRLVSENTWQTDLVSTTDHFAASFASSVRVRDQMFPTVAFRPAINAAWDPALPYGSGPASATSSITLIRNANDWTTIDTGIAPPTTGTGQRGSIRFNSNGTATGQPAAWYETAGGTPGTWVILANIGAT
jgi:hypothetical protein